MVDVKSSMFRKYYFQNLEELVKEIDEKVEILHGSKLRQIQSQRLKALHRCLEKNPQGEAEKNEECENEYKKSGLNWIQGRIESEKHILTTCVQTSFAKYIDNSEIVWPASKKDIDTCLSNFKENIFKRCFVPEGK